MIAYGTASTRAAAAGRACRAPRVMFRMRTTRRDCPPVSSATKASTTNERRGFPAVRPGDEKRWRRALKTAGVHVVRGRLIQSPGGSAAVISGIGTERITKGYVERWLRDQEALVEGMQTRRYRWLLGWTIVAVVAACIAAWPIVKEFVHTLWPN
jgi:hypothetical protein